MSSSKRTGEADSSETREERSTSKRLRIASARANETEEETTERRMTDRVRTANSRATESEDERRDRLQKDRTRRMDKRKSAWTLLKDEAFRYDPELDYSNLHQVSIGSMSSKCSYCGAFTFDGEPPGICCSSGKVFLPELPQLPEPLHGLINGYHQKSKEFINLTRKYNSSFQMTSFGTSIPIPKSSGYMPTFKIQGQVYHKTGSLLPPENKEPKFLQIYFLGNEDIEASRRCDVIQGTNKELIVALQKMLHENNHYVRKFKMALDGCQNEDLQIVIKADKKPTAGHAGVYNAPTVNEVAVIIAGSEFEKRDIVLRKRSNELKNISETHVSYDALQYPLMFPRGEDGYAINIKQVKPGTLVTTNTTVSAMAFYAYRLMIRANGNHLLNFRQLFHQFLVDMYAKIEAERLLFLRFNQKKLRVENYIHLKDAVQHDDSAANLGKLVILPSSYIGGPRNMHEYAQDAITYVRHGGKPSLFITYTFNPNCKEMETHLINGQTKADRHDLVARIFRQKLIKFINVITKGEVFGSVKYWLYSVEWQKRGLPHAHLLVWLTNPLKTTQIDEIISAEIPDENQDQKLHAIVIKNMIHGPCGILNKASPCMKDGKCKKMFPRQFVRETQTLTDGYPLYRRRQPEHGGKIGTIKTKSGGIEIDNRWVVPYNPLLLKMFEAHINVEFCNSVKSIKYILKYVHKGPDQGVFTTARENGEIDEIAEYQAGRYISSNEAAWRIFGFPIHERYPAVQHLDVHLENGQRVYFTEENLHDRVANPPPTTLTRFFELCASDDFAKTLLYCQVPEFYRWDKTTKTYSRRKQGQKLTGEDTIRSSDTLGRVYTVNVRNFDCYYLRMLLHNVKGPIGFVDLRTIDGTVHPTYHEACLALGLLENDNQWEDALKEATACDSPSKIRSLFAIILSYCEPSNPKLLWENHKESMSEDILKRFRSETLDPTLQFTDEIFNEALLCLEDKVLEMIGKLLQEIGMKSPNRQQDLRMPLEIRRELSYDSEVQFDYVTRNYSLLNKEQEEIYHEVLRKFNSNEGGLLFIDAPGGTGKTFLINLLLSRIRGEKKIAIAVASSGIAATLMVGGRTAHSTLKIPVDLIHCDSPVCNIKKGSGTAKLLMEAKILFWDEISMMNKNGFEAVNRTLQDIRGNKNLMGGLIVIIAGDFRQTLPVIPRGTMVDEIQACLKSSQLWKNVKVMKLTTNMRVTLHATTDSQAFSEYLLRIGDGREMKTENGKIKFSLQFGKMCHSLKSLIDCVYPEVEINIGNRTWLKQRTILTPLNAKVDEINDSIQSRIEGTQRILLSIDSCVNEEEMSHYPVEFLNSLSPNGIPPHKLEIKIGSPIILLRNLDPPRLCNGTRLIVKAILPNVIDACILTGPFEGEHVFIPRIPLIPTDLPFAFRRLQFPIRLSYAMTINKSQGQSMEVTGLDLTDECFSHGQLYVGISRAMDPTQLYILADEKAETKNIVYKQVLA